MDGGVLVCEALSSANNDTNYGIKGMNDENSLFTIQSASKVHIRARHDSSKVAACGLDIKLAHPTLKGLGFNHDYGMSDWQDDSYVVLEPVAVENATKLNYMSYWFATVDAEAVLSEDVAYDGEPHPAFQGFNIQQPLSEDGPSRMMARLKGETEFKPGVPKFTDAGTYEIEYYFEIDPQNGEYDDCANAYNPTDVRTHTFKILKIDGNITAPTAKEGLKENGQPLELVNAGSSTSGTVVYRLGDEGEFSENIPTAINAGTYTVQYKALESQNYKETAVGSVEVTIAKGSIPPTPAPRKNGLPGGAIAGIVSGAILLPLGIAFLLLFFVFAKFIVVKDKEGKDKVVRAIKIGKDVKDEKNYFWMMTFTFKKELKPEEEVFNKKKDAEEFLKKQKGEEEQSSEDK